MSESSPQLFARPGPVFKAKYPGKCWECGQRFPVGQRIRYIGERICAHQACAPSGLVRPISDPVLGDEVARDNMRSHKPNSWRRGRSPSSYG